MRLGNHVEDGRLRADTAVLHAKGDTHDLVMDVFDAPAPTRHLQQEQPWRAGRNEAMGADCDPVSAAAFGLHPGIQRVGLHLSSHRRAKARTSRGWATCTVMPAALRQFTSSRSYLPVTSHTACEAPAWAVCCSKRENTGHQYSICVGSQDLDGPDDHASCGNQGHDPECQGGGRGTRHERQAEGRLLVRVVPPTASRPCYRVPSWASTWGETAERLIPDILDEPEKPRGRMQECPPCLP